MFQANRQGNLFYILEKGENLKLKVGQVVSVSNPTPKYNTQFNIQPMGQSELVVDIRVKIEDETMEFKQLNATASIANSGNLIVSDNKEAMNAEVEGILRTSRQIIESVPYHEKVIVSCDAMLRELNPQFAKEKEQEEKIGMLEERMGNIDDKLNKMFDLLSDTLERKSKKTKEE